MELVRQLHSAMTAKLVGGGSRTSAFAFLKCLRDFFAYADRGGHPLNLDTVEMTYHHWCDFLLNRVRLREITEKSAYVDANLVSSIIGDALERSQPLISTTQIRMPRRAVRAVGVAADKQNLGDTFAFAHLCLDVIEGTSAEAIFGSLPPAHLVALGPGAGALVGEARPRGNRSNAGCPVHAGQSSH